MAMVKVLVKELNERFGISNALLFERDEHGMERANIKTRQAEATVYLQGAHITHYRPARQKPLLFLSSKSNFAPGKAIRGGIPIIYPWFGPKSDDPKAPMHGFARTSLWQVDSANQTDSFLELRLSLDTAKHSKLRLLVQVGRRLHIELEVTSASETPITFEEALHSYFAVSDVRTVFIQGLSAATFIDKTDQMRRKIDEDQVLRLRGETDRVYVNSESSCRIFDLVAKRCIRIDKTNSATTVVWNPWIEKAKKMADFGEDEWQGMLCIETANAADNAITLQPGGTHRMSASISAESFDPVRLMATLPHPQAARMRRAG
jgi:glucose-6-phosphate 1-epimerase